VQVFAPGIAEANSGIEPSTKCSFDFREAILMCFKRSSVVQSLLALWSEETGQDIAEYAVMLAVILVIVVGTLRLIGGNANNVFSSVASSIGQ
jgi:Flp pilus assembly pilin Flp